MLKLPFILFLVIGLNLQTFAQNQTEERAKNLTFQLENWYNLETGLWDTTSWWNGANVLTALISILNDLSGSALCAGLYP